jgi:hypothetical protein
VAVEQGKFRLRIAHDQFDRDRVSPIGHDIDISGQRQELYANEISKIGLGQRTHQFRGVVRANDDGFPSISLRQTHRDVVNNRVHSLHPHALPHVLLDLNRRRRSSGPLLFTQRLLKKTIRSCSLRRLPSLHF